MDVDRINSSNPANERNSTFLQQHVSYFDINKDGIIYPWETFKANIHKGKHGSDTGNYDYDGRFARMNFESLVKRYANTQPDKLTLGELWKMTEEHRVIFDFVGWIVAKLEFGLLYFLAKDEDGFLSKEAFYQVYDGTLFYNIAKKHKERKN
ncbi:hypothetical protein RD792_009640 [Penstemon davidsonii]|uniref:Caleosin n=1 Tax=Penstemon davidsonii TaxID=160366 RepID=A0ABR0CZK6_9LAMI|nr:hypothetical protein RD792_009640 [Penstemon davidsonii]